MEMCSDAEVEEAEESSYILMDYTPLDTPSSAGSWGQCPALRHAPDTEPALVSSSLPNHACTSAPSIQVTTRLTTPDPQHPHSCVIMSSAGTLGAGVLCNRPFALELPPTLQPWALSPH